MTDNFYSGQKVRVHELIGTVVSISLVSMNSFTSKEWEYEYCIEPVDHAIDSFWVKKDKIQPIQEDSNV